MRIALVTPAYNVAPWIAQTIRSALAQSHEDWRMVVVDDGSTDPTGEIVAGFADDRIRLIRQANAGVAAARNRGIAAAEAEAVLFLDADDWLAPDALARLDLALAAEPSAVAAWGRFVFVPEPAAPPALPRAVPRALLGPGRASPGRRPPMVRDLLAPLLDRNLFANGGHVLIRRAAVARAGLFRPGLAYGEDWEYWIRLALLGPFAALPDRRPVLFVRRRAGGAYLRMANDPEAFRPCMAAIFGNPDLLARFGADRVGELRARAEAENAWIIGRELIRHGRLAEGRAWLGRSVADKPTPKRRALLALARMLPRLPPALRGPFRDYHGP